MEWIRRKPIQDEGQIAQFERMYQFNFTPDFVTLVQQFNGARPVKNVFDTDKEREKIADRLLSFNRDDHDTIWQTVTALKTRLPADMMPFMMDPFGNYICFYADPLEDEHEIVYWQHEKTEGNIQHIAPNLQQFLAQLYEL